MPGWLEMCKSPFLLPILELLSLPGTTPSRALWGGTSHAVSRDERVLLSAAYWRGLRAVNSNKRFLQVL